MGFFDDPLGFLNDTWTGVQEILSDPGEILETAAEVGIGFIVAGPAGALAAGAAALDENVKEVKVKEAQERSQTAQGKIRGVQLNLDALTRTRQKRAAVRKAQVAESRIALASVNRGLGGSSIALGASARVVGDVASTVSDINTGRQATEKLSKLGADLSRAQQDEANLRADQARNANLFSASLIALSGVGGSSTPAPIEVSVPN